MYTRYEIPVKVAGDDKMVYTRSRVAVALQNLDKVNETEPELEPNVNAIYMDDNGNIIDTTGNIGFTTDDDIDNMFP